MRPQTRHGSSISNSSSSATKSGSRATVCCLSCTGYEEKAAVSRYLRNSTLLNWARQMGQLLALSTQGRRHESWRLWPHGRRWAMISSSSGDLLRDEASQNDDIGCNPLEAISCKRDVTFP